MCVQYVCTVCVYSVCVQYMCAVCVYGMCVFVGGRVSVHVCMSVYSMVFGYK